MISKMAKKDIISKAAKSSKDTGSPGVQIALIDGRIGQISKHLEKFPKDLHSRTGLMKLVGRRKRLVRYE